CPVEQGVSSFRIICDDPNYDFPALRSRTRTQVRRGLEECQVERIDFETLRKHAIQLNADTLMRQGRRVPANLERYWTKYYEAAALTDGAETWGAFVEGQLAAYLISFTIEDVANLLILRSALDHLKKFPNNALLFLYLQQALARPDIRMVCYGYESIQADMGSLDQFKMGMGFRQDPVGQRVELAGWARPILNRYTTAPAIHLLKRLGHSETSAKLQGILNWYQQQPSLQHGASNGPTQPIQDPSVSANPVRHAA
ncbi:MAG: hypothetical protein KDA85_15110, partial [Planctomycetaceae bacterium]|nr:hypothetical protein [Planctomycetaceae bacterium]